MKPYPTYKESGVEWLGPVPEGWQVWKMARAVPLISSGTTPNTETQEYYHDGEIPWVNTGDLNDDVMMDCAKRVTTFAIHQLSQLRIYSAGSVVIALYGATIGKLGILGVPACVNQACCVLSDFSTVADARFLFYWLLGFRGRIISLASGGGQPNISQEIIRSLRLALPPPPEQQTIAAFLDRETAKIDGLIEEQRRLIALLAEKRQAAISHAITRGLNTSARFKPSGVDWLGDVPEGWKVMRAGRVLRVQSGFAFSSEGFSDDPADTPLLRGVNITPGSLRWDDAVFWRRYHGDGLDAFELRVDDIVIGMDRPWIGAGLRIAQVKEQDVSSLLLQRVGRIHVGPDVNPKFVMHHYASDRFMHFLAPGLTGVSVPHISPSQIESFYIALPSRCEQDEIVQHLDEFLARLGGLSETAANAIALLQERRAALISAAVTGKIDVREAQASPVQARKSLSVSVLLGGVIIAALGRHASMGRMLVQKHLFMAEAHAGVSELQGAYDRQAAGPYDSTLQRRVEADLVAAGLLRVTQDGGPGARVDYEFLGDAAALRADLAVALGDRMTRFDDTFRQLADLSKLGIEAVATLYAAWNDFLMDGKNPSRGDIIREVLENWHDEKRDKFTKSDLAIWLDWMDRHQILPTGTGPKTQTGRLFP